MTASVLEVLPPQTPTDGTVAQRRRHGIVLAVAIGIIGLSMLLTTVDNRTVSLPGLAGYPLPEVCQSRRLFQLDCPGCGLTRSFIHFFHGRWAASYQLHRLGWLVAAFIILQIPYRVWAMATPGGMPLGKIFPQTLGFLLLSLLLINWLLGIAGL